VVLNRRHLLKEARGGSKKMNRVASEDIRVWRWGWYMWRKLHGAK
jgi:hypothetical protein